MKIYQTRAQCLRMLSSHRTAACIVSGLFFVSEAVHTEATKRLLAVCYQSALYRSVKWEAQGPLLP
jgi:hypothetical protein